MKRCKQDVESEYKEIVKSLEDANSRLKTKLAKYKAALKKRNSQYSNLQLRNKELEAALTNTPQNQKKVILYFALCNSVGGG